MQVRVVGVSNYSADHMRVAHAALAERGIPPRVEPGGALAAAPPARTNGVLDGCRELGVTLIAYQPLASGALRGGATRPTGRAACDVSSHRSAARGLATLEPITALLHEIGDRCGKTPAQMALRWLIENDAVLPIPGAKNRSQATANA